MSSQLRLTMGERIRVLRNRADLTLGDLAKASKVGQGYLGKLERGESKEPGAKTVARLAHVLHTTVEYLLGMTEDPLRPDGLSFSTDSDTPGYRNLVGHAA